MRPPLEQHWRSKRSKRNGSQTAFVFEVSSLVETEEVLRPIDLNNATLVRRQQGDAHLAETEQLLSAGAVRLGLPTWVMTGKAQSIQAIRKSMREQRIPLTKLMVKAYRAEGKRGLD